MKKGAVAALLCVGLFSASSWAIMPLSEKQLKTVCLAFTENKRALEAQMCGHYILGFLDSDIVGGDPRRICVPDSVTLADVMAYVVKQVENVKASTTDAARHQVMPILAGKWPCAAS